MGSRPRRISPILPDADAGRAASNRGTSRCGRIGATTGGWLAGAGLPRPRGPRSAPGEGRDAGVSVRSSGVAASAGIAAVPLRLSHRDLHALGAAEIRVLCAAVPAGGAAGGARRSEGGPRRRAAAGAIGAPGAGGERAGGGGPAEGGVADARG